MPATDRYQLLVESQTRGEAEVRRFSDALSKLADTVQRKNQQTATGAATMQRSVSTSLDKIQKDAESTGNSLKQTLANPLQAVSDKFLSGAGGASKFAGAAAGIAVGIGLASGALKTFIQEVSETALEVKSLSLSTGLTIGQADKLRAAANLTGFDIRNLKEAALDLSVALKDTGGQGDQTRQLLKQLGVSAFDASGKTRPLNVVLLETFDALSKVQDVTTRVNRSRVLGGADAAKSVQPLLAGYREANRLAEELGFGTRDGLLKALDDSAKQLRAFDLQWEIIKGKLAEKISPIIVPILLKVSRLASGDTSALPGAAFQAEAQAADDQLFSRMFPSIGAESLQGLRPGVPNLGDGGLSAGQKLSESFRSGLTGTEDGMKLRLEALGKERAQLTAQLSSGSLNESSFKSLKQQLARVTAEQVGLDRQLAFLAKARAGAELVVDSQTLIDLNIGQEIRTKRVPSLFKTSAPNLPEFVSTEADRDAANPFNDKGMGARAAGQAEADKRERELNVAFARQFVQFEQERINLLTGPGGELDAINKIYELKKAGLEQELQYGTEIFDLTERRLQIEQERTLSILNLQRQKRDEARGLASDFVGSIQAGNPRNFFREQGGRLINQVGTNLLTGPFQRIQSTLGGIGAASGLGGLLRGTLLDPSNAKPIDRVATATERTAAASEKTAAALTGRSIGGISIPGAGVSLPGGFDAIRALGPASGFTGGFTRGVNGVGAGLTSVIAPGGLFAGLRSSEGSIALGNGAATTTFGLGLESKSARVANVAGSIAAVGAGALTAYRGFKQGGLAGISQGITATLGTAALIPGPQQPFIAAAAATAALVSMLIPDPKQARDKQIDREINAALFEDQTPMAYNLDRLGRGFDSNKLGQVRNMGNLTVVIQALDSKSVYDARESIADAVRGAMIDGHGINRTAQEVVLAA